MGLSCSRSIDFRYVGQGFEVQVPLPRPGLRRGDRAELEALMRDEYGRLFGRVVEGVAFEIVNLRLFARAERGEPVARFRSQPAAAAAPR